MWTVDGTQKQDEKKKTTTQNTERIDKREHINEVTSNQFILLVVAVNYLKRCTSQSILGPKGVSYMKKKLTY